MVVIDELSISVGDMDKIQNNGGENSEIKKILEWLSVNTKMTLAALSSSSLLDIIDDEDDEDDEDDDDAYEDKKEIDFKWLPGFQTVELKNIMRTSQNIAEATSLESFENVCEYKIVRSIKPGTSSTVPGKRPRIMIYSRTVLYDNNKYNKLVIENSANVEC